MITRKNLKEFKDVIVNHGYGLGFDKWDWGGYIAMRGLVLVGAIEI